MGLIWVLLVLVHHFILIWNWCFSFSSLLKLKLILVFLLQLLLIWRVAEIVIECRFFLIAWSLSLSFYKVITLCHIINFISIHLKRQLLSFEELFIILDLWYLRSKQIVVLTFFPILKYQWYFRVIIQIER